MIFRVTRASAWRNNYKKEPPCPKAVWRKITGQDKPCWCVRLGTMKDLTEFTAAHGPVIIDGNSLEIYDDYVE